MSRSKPDAHSTTITIRLPKSLIEKIPAPSGTPGILGGRSAYIRGLIVKNIEASNASNAASPAHQGL